MSKNVYRFGALAVALGVAVSVAPQLGSAQAAADASASVEAQESVVVTPTDAPLIKVAKLRRNWVLYNDGATVWALYVGAPVPCTAQPCPADARAITKRAIQTMGFFTAFKANFRIVLVQPERLARFATGEPITSTDGLTPEMFIKRPYFVHRLLKAANSAAVYLSDGATKRAVVHEKVFSNLGLSFSDVETVPASELGALSDGSTVTAETSFDEEIVVSTTNLRKRFEEVRERLSTSGKLQRVRDAIVKQIGSNDYYLVTKNGKRPIRAAVAEAVSQRLGIDLSRAVEVTAEEVAAMPTQAEVTAATPVAEVNASAK